MTNWFWVLWLSGFLLLECARFVFRRQAVRQVDWQHIYEMECEVWGEIFPHLGAPDPLATKGIVYTSIEESFGGYLTPCPFTAYRRD